MERSGGGDSPAMRLAGKPKPPPAPAATPCELRMAKLAEQLVGLCATFEELAQEQHSEETKLSRVRKGIPERLAEIEHEVRTVEHEQIGLTQGSTEQAMQQAVLQQKIRDLEIERKALEKERAEAMAFVKSHEASYSADDPRWSRRRACDVDWRVAAPARTVDGRGPLAGVAPRTK